MNLQSEYFMSKRCATIDEERKKNLRIFHTLFQALIFPSQPLSAKCEGLQKCLLESVHHFIFILCNSLPHNCKRLHTAGFIIIKGGAHSKERGTSP